MSTLSHIDLARELVALAEYAQAESILQRVLRKTPRDPDANHLMCYILAHSGRLEQALFYAERAAAAAPNQPNTLANLGTTLMGLGRQDEAIATLRRAVSLERDGTTARHALALALNGAGRYAHARKLCEETLNKIPGNIPLTLDLADALQNLAHADQAVELLQGLVSAYPDLPVPAGNLAAAMNYVPSLEPEAIFGAHKRFAAALSSNLPPSSPPPITDPDADRIIRLGIIIPDLTNHPVGHFIWPILERLDPARFNLTIYYTSTARQVTPEWPIVKHTARGVGWEPLPRLDQIVRADRLDLLIELSGMTAQHRLQLLHLKPAPIQLTYAGYPNTTGMSAIDYRIVDSCTDPTDAQQFASEKLLRLDPCFLCYSSPPHAPTAPATPDQLQGIMFASFNHLPKINLPLIQLWSRILAAVPGSRLLLKAQGLRDADVRESILQLFTAAGIAPDRVELLPPTPSRIEHLQTYSRVSIALDTFPYHGTTTTCEALSMGVPVVSLTGNTHVSRVGTSLLSNLGLQELIASTSDEYVRIASELALDPPRLQALRRDLPTRFRASPLCDAASFAERFQNLLRSIWQSHVQS